MVAMPAFIAACGLANATGSPSHSIVARVGLVHPGEHLDQGGLAGAVLAEQAVHLAGPDLQLDAVERAYAGERLDDVGEPQHDRARAVVGCHDGSLEGDRRWPARRRR